jgi:hypothetical protein
MHVSSCLTDVLLGITTKTLGSRPGLGNARHRKKLTAEAQGKNVTKKIKYKSDMKPNKRM